jgi:hypothetical protein
MIMVGQILTMIPRNRNRKLPGHVPVQKPNNANCLINRITQNQAILMVCHNRNRKRLNDGPDHATNLGSCPITSNQSIMFDQVLTLISRNRNRRFSDHGPVRQIDSASSTLRRIQAIILGRFLTMISRKRNRHLRDRGRFLIETMSNPIPMVTHQFNLGFGPSIPDISRRKRRRKKKISPNRSDPLPCLVSTAVMRRTGL